MFSALNEEFVKCMIRQNKIINIKREGERKGEDRERQRAKHQQVGHLQHPRKTSLGSPIEIVS